ERTLNERPALGFIECPVVVRIDGALRRLAVGHAAKAQTRNFQAGVSEIDVVHDRPLQGLKSVQEKAVGVCALSSASPGSWPPRMRAPPARRSRSNCRLPRCCWRSNEPG